LTDSVATVRHFSIPLPTDLLASLRPLVASQADPTIRLRVDRVVRACRTPDGAATLAIRRTGDRTFEARAWGPGADWAIEQAPGLVGADDTLDGFDPTVHPSVARYAHANPGLRLIRSGSIQDVLVPTILAQRVTARQAAGSWTRMVRAWGEPAPGPFGLRLPPTPDRLASTPSWAFHRLGVERDRARTIVSACRRIDRLQGAVDLPLPAALERLQAIPGIGPWTAALVLRVAAGTADTVEVGDFHVKNQISYNLAGEPRGTDERMLELLAPFPGHRGRVVRLVLGSGRRPPTYGPRVRIVPVESL
jgi:3-methyladenine DNA glycosylase/8-oxoguanine DNA glycosylase